MKKFFEEYGFVALASIVVSLLVAMASPVGNLIKASTTELVNTFGEETNTLVSNFEVDNLNDSEESTGSPVINGPTVNLISFTISGTSYQAEEGMTWTEWVASDYNPTNSLTGKTYSISGNFVKSILNLFKIRYNDDFVASSDTIINNGTYLCRGAANHSGGGGN